MGESISGAKPRGWRMRGVATRALTTLAVVATLGVVLGACGDRSAEAQRLEAAGDWESALSVYQQLVSEDPDDLEALSGAAVALMVLQRFDEALVFQERLVAADPKDAQTRVELGFNYLNHQGRANDAVRVLEEAADLDPTSKNLTFLAQALQQAGDVRKAEQVLRGAIQAAPRYAYAYSQLVRLLESQGRHAEAEALVEEAATVGVAIDVQQ